MKWVLGIILIFILDPMKYNQGVNGKELFDKNCSICHSVNQRMIGPALFDVVKKKNFKWFMFYTISSKTLLDEKDKRAIRIQEEFSIQHPEFRELSKDEIRAIYTFIRDVSRNK